MNKKSLLVVICLFNYCLLQAITEVLLYCPAWGADIFSESYDRIECAEMKRQLFEYGIELKLFTEDYYPNNVLTLNANQIVIICDFLGVFQRLNLNGHEKKLYFITFQPPTLYFDGHTKIIKDFFGPRYYTLCDDFVGRDGINKIYFPGLLADRRVPQSFTSKKFMVGIYSNKMPLLSHVFNNRGSLYEYYHVSSPFLLDIYRKSIINFFAERNLDLFGRGWDKNQYHFYQGEIASSARAKIDCMQHYKFVLAIENTGGMKGYVTCQLFDPMIAGSVPIYADFNNAAALIPKNCYIDPRDFDTFDALHEYLITMTEERYNEYLQTIKKFLSSIQASFFTIGNFTGVIRNIVFDL